MSERRTSRREGVEKGRCREERTPRGEDEKIEEKRARMIERLKCVSRKREILMENGNY